MMSPDQNNPVTRAYSMLRSTLVLALVWQLLSHAFAAPQSRAYSPPAAAAAAAQQKKEALALLRSIIINGEEKTEAGDSEVIVRRAGTNRPEPVRAGMRLYALDKVETGKNTQVIILFLDDPSERDSEVIVDANTLIHISSVYTYVGRILARVKGAFKTRTNKVRLGVQGTEYELVVTADGRLRLIVLDGMVSVERGDFSSHETARESPVGVKVRADTDAAAATAGARRLEEVSVAAGGALAKTKTTAEKVTSVVNWSTRVILAGQPTHPPESTTPHFASAEERSRKYRDARLQALLRDDADSYQTLGDIYTDWGRGAKAVEAYRKIRAASRQTSPALLTDLGEAYRLMGRLAEAEAHLSKALSLNRRWTPALNALGNVYLDQAAIARDKGAVTQAKGYLERAKNAYAEAIEQSPPPPQLKSSPAAPPAAAAVPHSNLGEVFWAFGNIARDEGRLADAMSQYEEAEQAFRRAEEIHPAYPFARAGIGEVYRQIRRVALLQGDKTRADEAYVQSQAHYTSAIRAHHDLATAYVGVGNLLADVGREGEAIRNYLRAVQARPEEPEPYYHLGAMLERVDLLQAAEYFQTYLQLAPAAFRQGRRAAHSQRVIAASAAAIPPSAPPNMGSAPKVPYGIGRLDLRVIDDKNGPLRGARAHLKSRWGNMFCETWKVTDDRGVALLVLSMGNLELTVEAPGYQRQIINIARESLAQPVRVKLTRSR